MADLSWCVVGVFLVLAVRFSDNDLVIGLDNGLALTPPSESYLLSSRFEHEFVLISLSFCGSGLDGLGEISMQY